MRTRNVVGAIAGDKHPADVFLYSAHWDHLGVKTDVAGADTIYNGAVDNGMGVASILELAEKFAHARPPRRTIGFMFWTLEEQGLLGSEYFAEHPLWPLNHIVGVVNLDANIPKGRARDMMLPGSGQSELEDYLSTALKTQNRVVTPDPEPERGSFFRSDHFSLAKYGIPAISPDGGYDLIEGGKTAGKAVGDEYRLHRYHRPSDEWSASWDLSGPVEDLEALFLVGETLANGDAWPGWYAGSEFKSIRDKTMTGGR
jgi:Zn-dependent M28 family amino/carboxypeptidase